MKQLVLLGVLLPSVLLAKADKPGLAVVAADRHYAEQARSRGEWTATRAVSLPMSEMFVPQRVKVLDFGKGLPDPKVATRWVPEQAWLSCDGTAGVTMGRWSIPGTDNRGWYEAVWGKLADGTYRILLRHGGPRARKLHSRPGVGGMRAVCAGKPPPLPIVAPAIGEDYSMGASGDQTLIWSSAVNMTGDFRMVISLWDGTRHRPVLEDVAPAGRAR